MRERKHISANAQNETYNCINAFALYCFIFSIMQAEGSFCFALQELWCVSRPRTISFQRKASIVKLTFMTHKFMSYHVTLKTGVMMLKNQLRLINQIEGWKPEGCTWHFTNFTGEPKQQLYHSLIGLCVLISIVYNTNLYTHGWQYICQLNELIKSFHLIYIYISAFHQKCHLCPSGSHPSKYILKYIHIENLF